MAQLGQAYVQIIPKAEGISGKISEALGGESTKAGKQAGANIAGQIKSVLAKAAIGATVVKGLSTALSEGGKLEQSFGGLETIYGDAADAAKKYAQEAAQAGISANDYAEQAVGFGASLKQAFKGDTVKAVEAANTAIMDMTDNAAKMGTPIESIQNAYAGFAKQNYTMLDNLKLGYGGTKSEMERLLADATKLSGVKYNINNLGDVYDAIHVIQGDLGLTGVAAAEASETFSGSFEAMKASASNLAGALATGEGIDTALQNLGTSASAFLFNNLIPMLGRVATALPGVISTAISTAAPIIQQKGPELLGKLATGIQTALPTIAEKAKTILTMIGNGITANLPTILDKGRSVIVNLFTGITSNLPSMADAASNIIDKLSTFLETNLPVIGEKGGKLLTALAANIIKSIPDVIAAAGKIALAIGKALNKLRPAALSAAKQLLTGLMRGIETGTNSAVSIAKKMASDVVKSINEKLKPVKEKVKTIMDSVKTTISNTWTNIKTKTTTLWNSIKEAITKPIKSAQETVKGVVDKIKGFFPINIGNIFSNFKTPHISLSTATATVLGKTLTYPTGFNVTWAAKGMILDGATLIGAGEAGREGIIPLEGRYMRPFAKAVADEMPGGGSNVTINVTVNGADSPEEWGRRLAREMQMQVRMA